MSLSLAEALPRTVKWVGTVKGETQGPAGNHNI